MAQPEVIGSSPDTYGVFIDKSAYPTEPAKNVMGGTVETRKGRRSIYKATSPEDFLEEYGHDPQFSLTTYAPLLTLQESNKVAIKRVTNGAKNAGAILARIPDDDAIPAEYVGKNILRPMIVGEENDDKELILSDDMVLAVYNLSPGESDLSYRFYPEVEDPEGGFWFEVYEANNTVAIERFQCSLMYRNDGNNDQMFIEERVNGASNKVRVVVNRNAQFRLEDDIIDVSMLAACGGGDNGERVLPEHIIATMAEFADQERIRINTFVTTGWESPTVLRAADLLAKQRKDCFSILDVPVRYQTSLQDMIVWRNETLRIDSSFSALYGKHVIVQDRYANMQVAIPLSAAAAGCYAYTDNIARASWSPAGMQRGDLQRFAIIGVHGDPHSRPDRDKLHNAQINSIKTLDEVGSFIWDDVTLQRRKSMGTFIGASRLRAYLYRQITDILNVSVFDPNDLFLRDQIDLSCKKVLTEEQRGRGLRRFMTSFPKRLNTLRAQDAGKLYYRVIYTPVASARQIIVEYTMTNSSVDFDDLMDGVL